MGTTRLGKDAAEEEELVFEEEIVFEEELAIYEHIPEQSYRVEHIQTTHRQRRQ